MDEESDEGKYGFFIQITIFLIIVIIIFSGLAIIISNDEKKDYHPHRNYEFGGPFVYVFLNNDTNNYEVTIGPIGNGNGPVENINVSITVDELLYYDYTNVEGYATIHIPSDNVENIIGTYQVDLTAEGYDDQSFDITIGEVKYKDS
jgi:hypothetical protein